MASTDPLFELSFKRWPPIYRYKRQNTSQKTFTAEVVIPAEATSDSSLANLTSTNEQPPPNPVAEQEQSIRPTTSSSEGLSSVPMMNPYPITFPVTPLPDLPPPLTALPLPFPPPLFNSFQNVAPPLPLPSSSRSPSPSLLDDTFQQFGVTPNFAVEQLLSG